MKVTRRRLFGLMAGAVAAQTLPLPKIDAGAQYDDLHAIVREVLNFHEQGMWYSLSEPVITLKFRQYCAGCRLDCRGMVESKACAVAEDLDIV